MNKKQRKKQRNQQRQQQNKKKQQVIKEIVSKPIAKPRRRLNIWTKEAIKNLLMDALTHKYDGTISRERAREILREYGYSVIEINNYDKE